MVFGTGSSLYEDILVVEGFDLVPPASGDVLEKNTFRDA